MSKRTNAVMVRLNDAQLGDLNLMADKMETPASTLAHNAVTALLRAYRRDGYISLPLEFSTLPRTLLPVPESDSHDPQLNEPAAPLPDAVAKSLPGAPHAPE